jgi:hypothetical protein
MATTLNSVSHPELSIGTYWIVVELTSFPIVDTTYFWHVNQVASPIIGVVQALGFVPNSLPGGFGPGSVTTWSPLAFRVDGVPTP